MADLITMLAATAGQAGEQADPDFKQTVLLLHGDGTNGAQNNTFLDSSSNNFSITRNGNTTQGTFSPFSAPDGYWGNYFDGTDDYLSVADNAVLRPGAGAFTLEAWVYRNAAGAAHTIYAKGGASTGINFQITSGNVLRFTHTTTNIDSTGTVAANAWVHVAVVREGTGTNQTKLYINGVQDGQGTVSTDFTQTEEVRIGTNRGATDDFAGYISNVRFVKGSALYTAGFTPSTVPLTTTSQGASSSEVELLTCQSNRFVDNSSNAFAITRNGDVRVTPFSPFAPSAAYSTSVNGGSGYFDGNGDNIVAPNNSALAMGTSDFQIEFWAYNTSLPASFTYIDTRPTGTNGSYITVGYNNSGNGIFLYVNTMLISTGLAPPVSTWNHFVLSRVGSTTRLFMNGSQIGSATDNTNYLIGAQGMAIGSNSIAADNYFPGYISSFRVVKGSGVTSVTVPTAPLTAITNTSLLCNFTNAGIFDNTGKNNLETVADAQIDTTTKKFGTGSMEFDGTDDRLVMPSNPELNLSSGNFTIEAWVYWTGSNANAKLLSKDGAFGVSYPQYTLGMSSGYMNAAIGSGTGVGYFQSITSNTLLPTNQWVHIAFVKNGTNLSLYQNGTSVASATQSGTMVDGGKPLLIGYETGQVASFYWNGYIDDLRITKGIARYTANFTPPAAAFPDL